MISHVDLTMKDAFLGALCVCVLAFQPHTVAAGDDEAWKEARDKLGAVIQARIDSQVRKQVTLRDFIMKIPESYRNKYGIRIPLKDPAKTPEQLVAEVDKKVAAVADRKYPKSELARFRREAEGKYRVFDKGEKVSFVIRGGVGPNTTVQGMLRDVTSLRIRVGNRWIPRMDMDETTLARYDEEISKKYIERFVRAQTNRYNIRKEDYAKDQRQELLPQTFRRGGYIPKRNARDRLNPENWISVKQALENQCASKQKSLAVKLKPQVEQEVYTAHGYVMQDGQWMPKKVANSIMAKLKKLRKKKEEEEAELDDDWGDEDEGPGDDDMMDGPPDDMMSPEGSPEEMMERGEGEFFDEEQ